MASDTSVRTLPPTPMYVRAPTYPVIVQQSLLSLSIAAASAQRIPTSDDASFLSGSFTGPSSLPSVVHHQQQQHTGSPVASAKLNASAKHRRMSSAGLVKRRLSDAREATSRPSAVTISTAASALTSLATLSLSTSPACATTPAATVQTTSSDMNSDVSGKKEEGVQDDLPSAAGAATEVSAGGITIKNGKKRGVIFKCESCSKVYRHPSCLIKHRWEHSPQWREASKFLLSKHQQVQLLEGAAILSHLSRTASGGTPLPEDRSLWPSFLSGGALPPPSTATPNMNTIKKSPAPSSLGTGPTFPTSSSMPSLPPSRPLSTGPRLHDYSIPAAGNYVTHVRPGVLSVPTGPEMTDSSVVTRAVPVPVPVSSDGVYHDTAHSYPSDPWDSPVSLTYGGHSYSSYSGAHSYGTGEDWSVPRSSVRSVSVTSGSRSRSGSAPPKSDLDDGEFADVEVEVDAGDADELLEYGGFSARGRTSATRLGGWRDEYDEGVVAKPREAKIEEEWDGMEMEMEM